MYTVRVGLFEDEAPAAPCPLTFVVVLEDKAPAVFFPLDCVVVLEDKATVVPMPSHGMIQSCEGILGL